MLTALLLSLSLSASGDAIYVEPGVRVVLDLPQKMELATAVLSGFPGLAIADLDKYHCASSPPEIEDRKSVDLAALAASLPWVCQAFDGDPETSDAAALDYELESNGLCKLVDRKDGSTVLHCINRLMSSDGRIINNVFTGVAFDKPLNQVWDFTCERNPQDATEITCVSRHVKIASATVWRTDSKAGKVIGTFGKVK
jgi:hypothetical protein